MKTITQSRLNEMLENEEEAQVAIEEYFKVRSDSAFSLSLELREDVTIVDDVTDGQMEGFALTYALRNVNNYYKKKRKKRFERLLIERPEAPTLVSEGDSWFNHPYLTETIDCLYAHYNILSLGEAGDTLARMTHPATREYRSVIEEIQPCAFIFSGIGNDILGDITKVVKMFNPNGYGSSLREHLSMGFVDALASGLKIYREVAGEVDRAIPGLPMFVHGYDYAVPGSGRRSPWLKKPMTELQIPEEDQPGIVRIMIDELNRGLQLLADETPNLHYVDCRNAAVQPWDDEIHPNNEGYQEVANRFHSLIQKHLA